MFLFSVGREIYLSVSNSGDKARLIFTVDDSGVKTIFSTSEERPDETIVSGAAIISDGSVYLIHLVIRGTNMTTVIDRAEPIAATPIYCSINNMKRYAIIYDKCVTFHYLDDEKITRRDYIQLNTIHTSVDSRTYIQIQNNIWLTVNPNGLSIPPEQDLIGITIKADQGRHYILNEDGELHAPGYSIAHGTEKGVVRSTLIHNDVDKAGEFIVNGILYIVYLTEGILYKAKPSDGSFIAIADDVTDFYVDEVSKNFVFIRDRRLFYVIDKKQCLRLYDNEDDVLLPATSRYNVQMK